MTGFQKLIAVLVALVLAGGLLLSCSLTLFEMPTTKELHFEQGLFQRYKEIVIDNTGIAEQLRDFPVLVRIDNTRISDPRFLDPSEDRFRFYDASGNFLAFEMEEYNPLGNTFIWVKIPHIEANSSATHFFLYFDLDSRHDGLSPSPTGVWSNNYLGVWHLEEGAAAGPYYYSDSSGNGNTGVSELDAMDPLTGPAPAAGRIGGGQRIVNDSDGIRIPPSFSRDLGPVSVSFWINADAVTGSRRLFYKGDSSDTRFDIFVGGAGRMDVEIQFDDGIPANDPDRLLLGQTGELSGAAGSWRWYVINWTGTTACGGSGAGDDELDGVFVYRDGVWRSGNRGNVDDGQGTYLGDRDVAAYIGNAWWATAGFPGTFDEVRVSTVVRSPRWIEAQYRSMTDTYLDYSLPEVIVD